MGSPVRVFERELLFNPETLCSSRVMDCDGHVFEQDCRIH